MTFETLKIGHNLSSVSRGITGAIWKQELTSLRQYPREDDLGIAHSPQRPVLYPQTPAGVWLSAEIPCLYG